MTATATRKRKRPTRKAGSKRPRAAGLKGLSPRAAGSNGLRPRAAGLKRLCRHPVREAFEWLGSQARTPKRRTMREFAEQELVIPDGPYRGNRFRVERQPYTALWLEAAMTVWARRIFSVGPVQSGKTLIAFVLPLLYHLFEVGETVIVGIPSMDIAGDKWREDIKPAIECSRYAKYLPTKGPGSRDGTPEAISFKHGPTLKFMSGGGGDEKRSAYTARVVVITEVDKFEKVNSVSLETDKISQIEARTKAFGDRKRIYGECTVSVKEGRIWREYMAGSESKIVRPCPHCSAWVTPEREHLVGWLDADTKVEAEANGFFACPACGHAWSESDRRDANMKAVLLHKGQTIEVGRPGKDRSLTVAALKEHPARGKQRRKRTPHNPPLVRGEPVATDTIGFRWSAVDNMFVAAGEVAAEEWSAVHEVQDEEDAEKKLRQFTWAIPYTPPIFDLAPLSFEAVRRRTVKLPRGVVPRDASIVTVAVDLGKFLCHWMGIAWQSDGKGHVFDYGKFEVDTDQFGLHKGLTLALRQFREICLTGWQRAGSEASAVPNQVFIDAGYMTDVVYAFCRAAGKGFMPAFGRGSTQQRRAYARPRKKSSTVVKIGEEYHVIAVTGERLYAIEVNADYWKTSVQQRLGSPIDSPGAIALYAAMPNDHLKLSKHLTSESPYQELVAGKGMVTRWKTESRQNHWLDCSYNCCAAAHLCGVRVVADGRAAPTALPKPPKITMPDGRPYLVTERR